MSSQPEEAPTPAIEDVLNFGQDQLRAGGCSITPLGILCVLSVILVASAIFPNFIRSRAQGRFVGCKSNLKNLGTACEMYSTDWAGKYPTSLTQLTPKYLKTLPECSVSGTFTYQYRTGIGVAYNAEGFEDYYWMYCAGKHHQSTGYPENYPQYDGIQGLIER